MVTKVDITRQGSFSGDTAIGHKLTSVTDPTLAQDAATKAYVDNAILGLQWKQSVRVATTVTGTLATAYEDGDTVDGVVLATGDRILLKNQSTGSENGIYTVNASGAPTRSTDADASSEVKSGLAVWVDEGTANGDTGWTLTTNDPIILGTDALVFAKFSSSTSGTVTTVSVATANGFAGSVANATTTPAITISTTVTGLLKGNGTAVSAASAGSDYLAPSSFVTRETPTPAVDGVTTVFTLANTPLAGTEEVFLNGVLQEPGGGNDYTISGATITYLAAPLASDRLRVNYRK